jgi:hypothetical protein
VTSQDSLAALLSRAAVRPEYESELRSLLGAVLADEAARAHAEELVAALADQVGRYGERGTVFSPGDADLGPERGAVPLMALLAVLPEVDRSLRERGIDDDARAATLGEIRRQVDKTVRLTGRPGLADYSWVETVWRGGFAQLGRLQYELICEDEGWVLNTHIPVEGAMGLDAVRASLARARETMQAAYPEVGPLREAVCHSWLFDRQLPELLPGSNIAAFADLWDITPGESGSGDAEGLYFVFDLPRDASRLDVLLPTLTATSRLQAALLDMWRGGGHLAVGSGRLVFS